MKFSWKICIATLALSLVIACAGGFALLSALFQSSYQRETKNAAEENRMLQYSFAAYWNMTAQDTGSSVSEGVRQTAGSMAESIGESELNFRIYDEDGRTLYTAGGNAKLSEEEREKLLNAVSEESRASMLLRNGESYHLVTASAMLLEGEALLYLESDRDVTAIFLDRQTQYGIYRRWMAGFLLLQGAGCYLIAVWLLKPLGRLSRAARRIAGGDLEVRARVETQDEIGQLAADFNHMADNLEKQFKELEDAARRQEDFIGSFAHELKTPLTSMIGYADMLRTREMGQEERFAAANYIFKEGKRLESLSFKLLNLLVVRHGELEKRPVRARWLAEEIQATLRPALEQAGITLQTVVEDEQVPLEPDLMKTVLLNLLDNGRKAIEGEGTLYLLGRRESEGFAFYVRDTGKGMQKEELSRITEAFYMVDKSRARRQGGAGLGLSVCEEIVKRHGGTLSFQSIVGKGTLVRVYLPSDGEEQEEN